MHLLRQYATTKPQLTIYAGGLPQRQLLQVLVGLCKKDGAN
ncbi:hypothetical protein [Chroococcidiopsis sp. SAG 2025]|nr:hypothetical protein [Chroococcidiopsis sp. SAG 2025]